MQRAINQKDELIQINEANVQHPYYCPSCGAICIIKQGDKKRHHFAHKQNTSCQSGEGATHRLVKKELYDWISKTDRASSEFYFPELKQRADIYVPNMNHIIEYQESHLQTKVLKERMVGYRSLGKTVTWLTSVPKYKGGALYLSQLQIFFINYHPKCGFYLLSYCSITKRVHLYYDLRGVSTKRFFAKVAKIGLADLTYSELSRWIITHRDLIVNSTNEMTEHKRQTAIFKFKSKEQRMFQRELYSASEHLLYFPYYVGVVLPQQWLLDTDAFIWQYRLIKYIQTTGFKTIEEISQWWDTIIAKKYFVYIHQQYSHHLWHSYLKLLVKLGYAFIENNGYIIEGIVFNAIEKKREWPRLKQAMNQLQIQLN